MADECCSKYHDDEEDVVAKCLLNFYLEQAGVEPEQDDQDKSFNENPDLNGQITNKRDEEDEARKALLNYYLEQANAGPELIDHMKSFNKKNRDLNGKIKNKKDKRATRTMADECCSKYHDDEEDVAGKALLKYYLEQAGVGLEQMDRIKSFNENPDLNGAMTNKRDERATRTMADECCSKYHDDEEDEATKALLRYYIEQVGAGRELIDHIKSFNENRDLNGKITNKRDETPQEQCCKIHGPSKYENKLLNRRKLRDIEREKHCERHESYLEVIAERNASELIQEEEKAKLRALRKKAKKDRQKQKKSETDPMKMSFDRKESTERVLDDEDKLNLFDEEDQMQLEEKSAFLIKSVKKVEKQLATNNKPKSKSVQEKKDVESIIKKASDLTDNQKYKEAIQHLSEAIVLAPTRVDLLLKRSRVYFEIAKYKKSLRDAENCLKLHPFNAEGYYRLGEAHSALKNYLEADAAFTKLAENSTYQSEVNEKLFSLRIKQLIEMGFNPNESFTALLKSENRTLDEAIDFLTCLQNGTAPTDDLYYSDEEDSENESSEEEEEVGEDKDEEEEEEIEENKENNGITKTPPVCQSYNTAAPKITISKKSPILSDPSNPFHCGTLFVVNMKTDITTKEVQDVFAKFGEISNIKLVTKPKVYAFVNYNEWQSAGQAMQALQGSRWLLSTTKELIIKYPVNLINDVAIPRMKNLDVVLNKLKEVEKIQHRPKPTNTHFRPHPVNRSEPKPVGAFAKPPFRPPQPKRALLSKSKNVKDIFNSGAPNTIPVMEHASSGKPQPSPKTEECYYWRTTGCTFGKKCFNLHVPGHKGIALRDKSMKLANQV